MRILITNDDGIDAPGLAILEEAARSISDDVWTVAPATEQSGQSRAVTLVSPLRIARLDEKRFAVSGTPADCVAMAMNVAMDGRPDLVLSGINQGFNIADDMLYSGTVGAAMEASMAGVRAIAFSQAYRKLGQEYEEDIWSASRDHATPVLRRLLALEQAQGIVLNVNFPPIAGAEVVGTEITRQGSRASHEVFTDDREDSRGHSYHWLRFRRDAGEAPAGTDLAALADGKISVTPLGSDLTAHHALESLKSALAG